MAEIWAQTNNLGNIRATTGSNKWKGEVGEYKGFAQFDTVENGLRALYKLLGNYGSKYSRRTIARIIDRYAPPNENDTTHYVDSVSKWSGIDKDEVIHVEKNKDLAMRLIAAMVRMETGQILTPKQLNEGWNLAFDYKNSSTGNETVKHTGNLEEVSKETNEYKNIIFLVVGLGIAVYLYTLVK